VVEKSRLNCEVKDAIALFKELLEHKSTIGVMYMLRNSIYANGELVIKPQIKSIKKVGVFEGVTVPSELVGDGVNLLKYLLKKVKMGVEKFSELSGINEYLLRILLRGNRGVNVLVSKELEVATGVSSLVWLTKRKRMKNKIFRQNKKQFNKVRKQKNETRIKTT